MSQEPRSAGPSGPLDGVRVLLVTSGHEATDPRIYAKQACGLRRLGAVVTVVGRLDHTAPPPVKVLTVPGPSSRLARFLGQPWRCLWMARHLDADIIHFHDAELLATLPVAKLRWWQAKFIYDVHEDFPNLLLVRDWLPSWARPAARILTSVLEKSLALLADGIVGVTAPLSEKFWNRRKVVAHNYVVREFFERATASQPPAEREFDLVHLGTLSRPRAIFLAEVIGEFHRLRPGSRSIVIGVPPDIEQLIKPRLPDGCRVLGRTRYEEIPRLLGSAKVGVNVHPWSQRHLEVALPVKVCEYMAAGCAVVSSALPILTRVLQESHVRSELLTVIEGGAPGDYAGAAVQWVQAIERGEDPGAKLRDLAREHLTWEGELARIADLYRRLVAR